MKPPPWEETEVPGLVKRPWLDAEGISEYAVLLPYRATHNDRLRDEVEKSLYKMLWERFFRDLGRKFYQGLDKNFGEKGHFFS